MNVRSTVDKCGRNKRKCGRSGRNFILDRKERIEKTRELIAEFGIILDKKYQKYFCERYR